MSNKLVQSYLFLFVLQLCFNLFFFIKIDFFIFLFLVINIIATIFIFFYHKKSYHRVLLLLFMTFAFPRLSFPIEDTIFQEIFSSFLLSTDRLLVGVLMSCIYGFLFFLEQFYITLKNNRGKILFLIFICFSAIIFVFLFHNYENYSKLHSILDFSYIINIASLILFFNNSSNSIQFNIYNGNFYNDFITLSKCFAIIISFDIIISLTGFFPHSISYREGIQGVLYGFELPYSYILGFVCLFFLSSKKFLFFKKIKNHNLLKYFTLLLFIFLLFLTNIKTSYYALFLVFIFLFFNFITIKKKKILLLFFSIFFVFNSTTIVNNNGSLATRAGINSVYIAKFVDKNYFLGMMPGISQVYLKSNLAEKFFSENFSLYIQSRNIRTNEILERGSYEGTGSFLPHNMYLCILMAYGLLTLPFILSLLYISFKVIFSKEFENDNYLLIKSFLLFAIIFSFSHPFFVFFEIIFCLGFLQKTRKFI